MVIDHRYKFIFVELPLTATSAISKEIREQYGCEPFLNKHATYDDFLILTIKYIRGGLPCTSFNLHVVFFCWLAVGGGGHRDHPGGVLHGLTS